MGRWVARLLVATIVGSWLVSGAGATPPGVNGRIVYVSDLNAVTDLYSSKPDGTDQQRLTGTYATERSPSWSPDGTQIAFQRDGQVWVMKADGSDQHQLTAGGGSDPAYSPDGSQIAFANTGNVWILNVDGTGLRRVSSVAAADPAWSPDGSRLAYVGQDGIGVVGVDGSDPQTIGGPGGFVETPSWSPDGQQVAFSGRAAIGLPIEIYVVGTDGSGELQLTHDGQFDSGGSWSPDGTELVFQQVSAPDFTSRLFVVGSDGSDEHPLAENLRGQSPDWGSSQTSPQVAPEPPLIDIGRPAAKPGYLQGQDVRAAYRCDSAFSFIVSCAGDVPYGEPIDTSAGTHTFTVRATDADGRTSVDSVTYDVVDLYPPQIALRTPVDGGVYALGSAVGVDYSCSDPGGLGIDVCAGDRPVGALLDTSRLGSHTFTVVAGDKAFHLTVKTVTYTVVASPVVSISSPGDGDVYALGAAQRADYSCNDPAGVGIRLCDGSRPAGSLVDTTEPGLHTFTVNAVDNLGDRDSKTVAYRVVAPPEITISSPTSGSSYTLGASLTADYTCFTVLHQPNGLTCNGDLPSGSALDTSTVGPKTFSVVSTDRLGQRTARTSTYSVVYPFGGFDSPVGADGSFDGAKAGQGVPLKFSLGGDRGAGVVSDVSWQQVSCSDGSSIGQPSSGGGKLSYAPSTGRYVELVSTDAGWRGSCRTLTIQLADSTLHHVSVRFAR